MGYFLFFLCFLLGLEVDWNYSVAHMFFYCLALRMMQCAKCSYHFFLECLCLFNAQCVPRFLLLIVLAPLDLQYQLIPNLDPEAVESRQNWLELADVFLPAPIAWVSTMPALLLSWPFSRYIEGHPRFRGSSWWIMTFLFSSHYINQPRAI